MLVLTCQTGKSLIFGKEVIKVKILNAKPLGSHGQTVRLGIETPKNMTVFHEETYYKILENKLNQSDSVCLETPPVAPAPTPAVKQPTIIVKKNRGNY